MPEYYENATTRLLDDRQLLMCSNACVGFPRFEKGYCLTDTPTRKIHLRGPPIEVNHPSDYNSLKYRTGHSSGPVIFETMKYGVAGLYNETTTTWITSSISDIDANCTTITLSANISESDKFRIYYYAKVAYHGGMWIAPQQGDLLLPEAIDILVRVYNDTVTSRFGTHPNDSGPAWKWSTDAMYNASVSCSADSYTTLLNYSGTGTFRMSTLRCNITEIAIKIGTPTTWPDSIKVRITADGNIITKGFGVSPYSDDATKYTNIESTTYPGYIGDGESLFFDIYQDIPGDSWLLLDMGKLEVKDDIIVELNPIGQALTCDIYVRGIYTP